MNFLQDQNGCDSIISQKLMSHSDDYIVLPLI
ncbi:MAG: hypothetical protein ACI857_003353 [Arenicella sp.]